MEGQSRRLYNWDERDLWKSIEVERESEELELQKDIGHSVWGDTIIAFFLLKLTNYKKCSHQWTGHDMNANVLQGRPESKMHAVFHLPEEGCHYSPGCLTCQTPWNCFSCLSLWYCLVKLAILSEIATLDIHTMFKENQERRGRQGTRAETGGTWGAGARAGEGAEVGSGNNLLFWKIPCHFILSHLCDWLQAVKNIYRHT